MQLWHCPDCGWEGKAPDEVVVVFHSCRPKRTPRQWIPPDLVGTTLEETWFRVFADFAGGYVPPTPEEAQAETGEEGRRKRGTGFRDRDLLDL